MDRRCPDCGGTMKQGFLLDQGHGHAYATAWVEGRIEKSFWTGVKASGRAKSPVESYRCEKCGLLKAYAPRPPAG